VCEHPGLAMTEADDVQDRWDSAVRDIFRQLSKGEPSVKELFRRLAREYDVTFEQLVMAWQNTDFIGR
jgi:hypothetical protein